MVISLSGAKNTCLPMTHAYLLHRINCKVDLHQNGVSTAVRTGSRYAYLVRKRVGSRVPAAPAGLAPLT